MNSYYSNLNLLASTYGTGDYDGSTYNGQTTTTGSGANGGGLTNTGVMIAGVVTLAALILLVAVVVRIWRRPAKQTAEVITVESDPSDSATR
jgi:hypothetical protein